jgi:hypothetical protein
MSDFDPLEEPANERTTGILGVIETERSVI